ncbi:MAG: Holliday junction resolvase RuvX [Acidimicrobiia bacterium]|nr:Holliday junction resolvase RuvX [Acidimicrobiia bacterium]
MARVLGVDLGARRIGLACSDVTGTLASPLTVLERSGDVRLDHAAIVAAAREAEAERIVVGLPLSLDGSDGPAARAARTEVDDLSTVAGPDLPVSVHDERLTTVSAERNLAAAGVKGRARRKVIDSAAAAVMLQSWLEGAR